MPHRRTETLQEPSQATDRGGHVAARVLIVDDDELVRETLAEALRESGYEVTLVDSGAHALEQLKVRDYQIVFSDLVMPAMTGLVLCQEIARLRPELPVVLITGYGTVEIAREGLDLGAVDFISKPINLAELPIVVERNLERQRLQSQRAQRRSADVMLQAVEALVQALDIRDDVTARHSQRVARTSVTCGQLVGMDKDQLYFLGLAALLHDVGKIGVRDHILLKSDRLTEAEESLMRQHPIRGAEILGNISDLSEVVSAVLHHHENYDGSGYPDGLQADGIPLSSRIIRIADTWDAMVTDRPYRARLSYDEARTKLIEGVGTLFDPVVVPIFLNVAREFYVME